MHEPSLTVNYVRESARCVPPVECLLEGCPARPTGILPDRGGERRPDLKVLFLFGYPENAAVGNGHLDHGIVVLTKPFVLAAHISSRWQRGRRRGHHPGKAALGIDAAKPSRR
jgi:hypothetical protein